MIQGLSQSSRAPAPPAGTSGDSLLSSLPARGVYIDHGHSPSRVTTSFWHRGRPRRLMTIPPHPGSFHCPILFQKLRHDPCPIEDQTCRDDYRSVALASVVMKCYERLIKDFVLYLIQPCPPPPSGLQLLFIDYISHSTPQFLKDSKTHTPQVVRIGHYTSSRRILVTLSEVTLQIIQMWS